MNDLSDQQLLGDYAEHHSETAFAELVRRHVDLVYSAALRMTCEAHAAQDITQNVFVALARNARQLAQHPVLSGWLHRTARNLAAKAVRTQIRREAREQEAAVMNELLSADAGADWEAIAPLLDTALGELTEADRDAVMLRYFEKKSATEMAQVLGISSEAAQKRLNRAMERLRENFSKRNVTIGSGALAVLITANAVQSAPIGLAATISTAAILTGTTTVTSTAAVVTKTIVMTTLQKIIVTATVATLAGAGIYEAKQAAQLRDQMQSLQQSQTNLTNQLAEAQTENTRLSNLVAQAKQQKTLPDAQYNELLKLRGQKGQSQTALTELARMQSAARQSGTSSAFLTNAMAQGIAMAEKFKKKASLAKLARMKDTFHLTDDQAQAISDIMAKRIDEDSQRTMAVMSGQAVVPNPQEPSEDSEIEAVLTPDQQAAYPDFQQSEKQLTAQNTAKSEVTLMQNSIDLTPDQQSQVQAAFYQYDLNQGSSLTNQIALMTQAKTSGDLGQAAAMETQIQKQQLADKLKLLDGILTPDQLKTYQQSQQEMLDVSLSAMKMFMPATNTVAAQ